MRNAHSLALVIALSVFAADARADESSAAAQTLFKEGRAALQQGKFADACERLGRSDKLEPAVGTRLSLGECHERLGQTASAWASYNQAVALAMQKGDARAEVAKRRAAALEPKLARITIRVTSKDPEMNVKRNGVLVESAALDTAMPIDAGKQDVTAVAPGFKPWGTSVEIHDGESKEIRVPELERETPPEIRSPAPGPPPSDSRATLALGLEIGGGVALVTGLVVGGLAISKWSSVEDTCPAGRCPTDADRDRLEPDVSTARTLATVSTVIVGLGVVAIAAGVVLHLTAPSNPSKASASAGTFRF